MQTITISESYIKLVHETRAAQQAYFKASLEAKKTKQGIAFQLAKDLLREAKQLDQQLDEQTNQLMAQLHGSMTADQAIAAMKDLLNS